MVEPDNNQFGLVEGDSDPKPWKWMLRNLLGVLRARACPSGEFERPGPERHATASGSRVSWSGCIVVNLGN